MSLMRREGSIKYQSKSPFHDNGGSNTEKTPYLARPLMMTDTSYVRLDEFYFAVVVNS